MSVSVSVSVSPGINGLSGNSGSSGSLESVGASGCSGFSGVVGAAPPVGFSGVVTFVVVSPMPAILYAASPSLILSTIGLPSSPIKSSCKACCTVKSFPATSCPLTSKVEFLKKLLFVIIFLTAAPINACVSGSSGFSLYLSSNVFSFCSASSLGSA